MEDERGAGGYGDSGSPSEPPLSVKLADKSVAGNMRSHNQVEELFEDGDGEEIMVEVVGSDVYVDGVSGNGEGDCEMAEAGDSEAGVVEKNEEFRDVSREGDVNKMAEGRSGSLESKVEKHGVTEVVDASFSISVGVLCEKVSALPVGGVGVVDDEASNQGEKAANDSSVEASLTPKEATDLSPTKITEEKKTTDAAVDNISDLVTPESSNHHIEVVSDDRTDVAEEKEVFPSSDKSTSHDCVAAETSDDGQVHSVNASGGGELLDSGSHKDGSLRAEAEYPSTRGDCDIQGNSIHGKDVQCTEIKDSIPKSDAPSDVPHESQNCLDESHGDSHAGPESIHESSCDSRKGEIRGNDETLNIEGVLETHEAQLADVGNAAEVNTDQPIIATMVQAEMGDENAVISLVKSVEGDALGEKGMQNSSEILAKSLAGHGSSETPAHDDSAENIHIFEEGAHSKVETADVMMTEDPVPFHDPTAEGFANVLGSSNEAENLDEINTMPHEVTAVTANFDAAEISIPEETGNPELLVFPPDNSLLDGGGNRENCDEVYKSREEHEMPRESNGFCDLEVGHTELATSVDVEERESDRAYHGSQEVDAEFATEEPSSESDKSEMPNEEIVQPGGFLRMKQSGYLTPPENEGCFATSDLVWGKVRSHPWWPGQIFDPDDASEKAVKYRKKDSYLVAYFGDQTFAWNESSALKPFRSHFSKMEKQSNSESFQNAVDCTLEEVERRIHLGLSCSCIPKDDYAKIETQVVGNAGISDKSSRRYGVDQSSSASSFEPSELLEFIRAVAPCASSGADQLDLVIARAQLSAFCSFKGYRFPTEFPLTGELLEIDGDTEQISEKRHMPEDCDQSRKERSLMELMGEGESEYSLDFEDESVSLPSGKKRKALDSLAEGSEKRVSFSAAKSTSQAPKPSFKIGECIRRVANKLTGSTSLVKGEEMVVDGSPNMYEPSEKQSMVASAESLSVNDMLSQLELLAQDPRRRHHDEIRFFMAFRSSTALSRRGRKKRSEHAAGGNGEEFEFDDVSDSYWTDRIVQNYSAEQLLHERMAGAGNHQAVSFDKTVKAGRKPHSRKRYSMGYSPTSAPEIDEKAKRMKQESSPAELVLSFAERNRVPSEINLNKIFRRFGPLMESETEVDHESGSAKVIFKRGSDAEVARNSAEKFSIFGAVVVSYEIGYSPVISVKILPVTISQSQEEATLML